MKVLQYHSYLLLEATPERVWAVLQRGSVSIPAAIEDLIKSTGNPYLEAGSGLVGGPRSSACGVGVYTLYMQSRVCLLVYRTPHGDKDMVLRTRQKLQ